MPQNETPSGPQAEMEQEQRLRKMIEIEPQRTDLRVKLLRLLFLAGRAEEFQRTAAILRESATVAEWQEVQRMGQTLNNDSLLFAGDLASNFAVTDVADDSVTSTRRFGEQQNARPLLDELSAAYQPLRSDPRFIAEIDMGLLALGRPSHLYHARRLSESLGGAQIYFKREDQCPPGMRLAIGITGQAILARRLGRSVLVAGTVDGRKGVALASIAARFGLAAVIYMDKDAAERQRANLFQMRIMGAQVRCIDVRLCRNRDTREAALEHWIAEPQASLLVMGLDAGPEPYPTIIRELSNAIGRECRRQSLATAKRLPDLIVARGGGNADAIGLFEPFFGEASTRLVCVETDTRRLSLLGDEDTPGQSRVKPVELDPRRLQVANAILEGLEYPSVTREHAHLKASKRVEYVNAEQASVIRMIDVLSAQEGIVPPLETAGVIAWAAEAARKLPRDAVVVVPLTERVDKDIWDIARLKGIRP